MRILELRFKNLNSLYGEWIIDFTDPEYISNGIFALTGPTGAGKSTILDAVCLALYGATPRLGKITRSGNEIMSRQTGECYAEVLFESRSGCFRCHWEQRRAWKKTDGNLRDQEHQIVDADTGKPIETKKSLVVGIIEEKTGMDFDRFTRSILLAQGGFDTFLKADVEQKSRILEQITGTEIYSEISRRVHERQRDEREKLNLLQAETSGIMTLEPEQEKEIQQRIEAEEKQERELAAGLTRTGKAIAWLSVIDGLKKEISLLAEEAVKLEYAIEAFKPERNKLDRAVKAGSLDGLHATFTAVRKQQSDDQASLKTGGKRFSELEICVNKQSESLRLAEQQTIKAKEELKLTAPVIRKIRSLDQKRAEQKKAVSEAASTCSRITEKIDDDRQIRLKVKEKQTMSEKNLELIKGCLKEQAGDEWLISGLAGIEEQLDNLRYRQKEINQKGIELKKADTALLQTAKKLAGDIKQTDACRQMLEKTVENLQQEKNALNRLLGSRPLREYRARKESLLREMAFIRKIEELENHRRRLEDGSPCPLCGSRKHPFARGNVPAPDEIELKIGVLSKLISKAEKLESAKKKLEKEEADARKKLNDSEKRETAAAGNKKAAEKTFTQLKSEREKLLTLFSRLKQAATDRLQPLGITQIHETEVSSLLDSLRSRLDAWQKQVRKRVEIEKQMAELDSEIKQLDAVIENRKADLVEKQEKLETLKRAYTTVSDDRRSLYGYKNPDQEENCLHKAVADAEKAEKRARDLNSSLQKELTAAETAAESLKNRIRQRTPELKKAETDFLSALEPAGFSDEKQFLEARLKKEQLAVLSARAKDLDNRQTDMRARQKDRGIRLTREMARKITDKPLEELELEFREYETLQKELRDTIAGLNHKLNDNSAAKERIKEKQAIIKARKKECDRWEKLHGLIGSADGKKYRNFAQGLTFELMVSYANLQLEKMSDRYLLIRDNKQPLDLNVVDNYQAGEIRSTRNLSGGESFIVSLSLALGLSRMASRKVSVDSLFLDEGFGTLDEEALETALEALSGLQHDNKLIGIISHVFALKERITVQITVTPVSGGRSVLAGPGCNRR